MLLFWQFRWQDAFLHRRHVLEKTAQLSIRGTLLVAQWRKEFKNSFKYLQLMKFLEFSKIQLSVCATHTLVWYMAILFCVALDLPTRTSQNKM